MALKQHRLAQQYTYRRKIYVGKMKKQGYEGQGIMAHMVYYMSESRLRGKIRRINDALEADPVDIQTLKDLAISADGLISSDLRCQVWPKLLSVNLLEISSDQDKKKEIAELKQFHLHKYWRQVNLDVDRSHRRFPPDMRASTRRAFQRQLVKVIMRVLCKNQDLHYYQGYHDVAVTVLLVAGEDLATAILDQLSLHQLSDFMDGTMEKTNRMLAFLHPIIEKADPELQDYLIRSEVGQVFALSWLITWFGHVLNDFNTILRLFDFFLATHPLMPVYFGAALVIRRRAAVLGGECEMSYVHHLLSWIPDDLPDYVEELVTSANSLFSKYPPEKLTAAADQYFKDSLAMANYREICRNLENQRPDSVLRQRRKELAGQTNNQLQVSQGIQSPSQSNVYLKLVVWTLTASVGTMALYVLGSTKRWI